MALTEEKGIGSNRLDYIVLTTSCAKQSSKSEDASSLTSLLDHLLHYLILFTRLLDRQHQSFAERVSDRSLPSCSFYM